MQKILIVVPCYNEARRLQPDAFVEAIAADSRLSILFVDDGSTDATRSALEALCARRADRLSLLPFDQNRGKAEALRRGLLSAMGRDYDLVGYVDADLAAPLSEVAPMCALFDDPDIVMVLGSRVAMLGRDVRRSPSRHYLGRTFATVASLILGLDVYDTQCGAKLFRNSEVVRAVFQDEFSVTWSFDVEILARLAVMANQGRLPPITRSVVEYPLRHWRDVSGSKVGFSAGLRAGTELARIWKRYGRPGSSG